MQNDAYFSVIIPLYNKEKFIERTINSVLAQTHKNFEIIVINDGSSDNSLQVVHNIKSQKIRVFSQPNAGVSAARNFGASKAKNPYLAFIDGDDTWDEYFLSEINTLIKEVPNAGIYGSNNYFIYPSSKKIKNEVGDIFDGKDYGIIKDYFRVFANLGRSPFSNSNICIPKKIFDDVDGYKKGVKLTEDSDLWCRIAFDHPIAYTKKPLATYFLAQEGATHGIFENKQFQVVQTLQERLSRGDIKNEFKSSIQKLIALQKLILIKRGILTGAKSKIFSNFFDLSIIHYYPADYIKCALSMIIPKKIFEKLRK